MKIPKLKQLGRAPLQERVYDELRDALYAGKFVPGQHLQISEVAKVLNTSAMPVRTALVKLVAQGALEQMANGSVLVPRLGREAFHDLMTVRMNLEGLAAWDAAKTISTSDVQRIRKLAGEIDAVWTSHDIDGYLRFNEEFKFTIYRHCSSAVLKELIGLLWLRVGPFLRHLEIYRSRSPKIHFHNEIVDAMERNDANAAKQAMEEDIRAGRDFLLENADFDAEFPQHRSV